MIDPIIEIKISFNCHLTVYFSQKRNFNNYSCYFMSKVAAMLHFVRLCKRSGTFTLAQQIDLLLL